jgi:hypothetical protein
MNEDRIVKLEQKTEKLEDRIEQVIKDNKCDDREIQEALLTVAKNHIWKQGFVARIKFWANLIGAMGTIGGLAFFISYVVGWEVVRR